MRLFLLILAPYLAGMITLLAFTQIASAILWIGIFSGLAALIAEIHDRHERPGTTGENWEVTPEDWDRRLNEYVMEVRERETTS